MGISELHGKTQTILGIIASNDMGITLPHEHLFVDLSDFFTKPGSDDLSLVNEPISLNNLSWVRSHRMSNISNLQLSDEETAIDEVILFKKAGGRTIVEVTPINIGRNPEALARVSRRTGVNIIMGTAYYRETALDWDDELQGRLVTKRMGHYETSDIYSRTEEDIAQNFIRDISIGIDSTNIRAGLIGEIGCSWPLTDNERKVLRAAVIAQQETGAIISIHPGFHEDSPLEIVNFLANSGANTSRIIIDHICLSAGNHITRCKIAEMGSYLEWDLFDKDGVYPQPPTHVDFLSDQGRVRQIIQLIDEGYLNHILISGDICQKIGLVHYGGQGYAHILNNVVPIMQQKGLTEEQIHTILVSNPARAFSFS